MSYTGWVCSACGDKYGTCSVMISTWHGGTCGICGEQKAVTEARDFGYLPRLGPEPNTNKKEGE